MLCPYENPFRTSVRENTKIRNKICINFLTQVGFSQKPWEGTSKKFVQVVSGPGPKEGLQALSELAKIANIV